LVQTCNPSLLGGYQEDRRSRPTWANMFARPHFKGKKLGIVVCTRHSVTVEMLKRLWSRPALAKSETPYPK
jgi:hypothetical protein